MAWGVVCLLGCATKLEPMPVLEEAETVRRIESLFAVHPELDLREVEVEAERHEVLLRGRVDSLAARAEAENIAASTPGVREVLNAIAVGGSGETLTAAEIRTAVESRLSLAPTTRALKIDVLVEDSTVTLSGTVPTDEARQDAEEIARTVESVDGVRNRLAVSPG